MAVVVSRLTTLQENTINPQPKIDILTDNVNILTVAVSKIVDIQNARANIQSDVIRLTNSNELDHNLIIQRLNNIEKIVDGK